MTSKRQVTFPPELDDDQQAAVLYSPFREKSLNLHSWNRKMKFWEDLLSSTALQNQIVSFDVSKIPTQFERKGMTPKCLSTVIDELKRSGRIKSIDSYKKTNSWLSWGFQTLVKQPLTWGVGQILGSSKKGSDVYVWPEVVKKLGQVVVDLHQSNVHHEMTDNLVSIAELRGCLVSLIPSDQDFDIVLHHLEKEKKIIVAETKDKEVVVKFCRNGETFAEPVKELELQVFGIQRTQKKLEQEIELLSTRVDRHVSDARSQIKEGRKTMALHSLRKKKLVSKAIDRKCNSLNILNEILQKIQDARTNEMVVKACEAGVAAMKTLSADITVDKAESVMDDVQEALENHEEISQALSSSILSEEDDDLLEEELNALLTDEVKGNKLNKSNTDVDDKLQNAFSSLSVDDMDLPNVPNHSPSLSDQRRRKGDNNQPTHAI